MKVVLTPSLAPYKVVLLALIAAYCAGILPKETHRPLLATIVKYIEGPQDKESADNLDGVLTLDDIIHDITAAYAKADPENGEHNARDIEKRVMHAIWTLSSLDSLHSFITKAQSLLVKNPSEGKLLMAQANRSAVPTYLLTSSSFLGKFVHRCTELFESLEYDKAHLLWTAFCNFRESSRTSWSRKGNKPLEDFQDIFSASGANDDPSLLKSILEKLTTPQREAAKDISMVSQEDLTTLVCHQVHMLETYGTATPQRLKEIFANMAQSEAGKIPQIHYIKYLEAVRGQDYEGAFKWLHRYFDYRISTREGSFYHYALLCLASLHAHFNCDGEAIRAIEEAISVAREKKDMECLNFLLTWLFNFMKDRPGLQHQFYVSNNQLLQFLKFNAGSSSKSLHSKAYQSDVALLMMEGGSLTATLESFTKALFLSLSGETSSAAFISYCALISSFWFRQGNTDLAQVYNDIGIQTSTSDSEHVSMMIRKANHLFTLGDLERAFIILDEQKPRVSGYSVLTKELSTHKSILCATQNIRMCQYNQAEYHLSKLLAQSYVGIDIEGIVSILNAELQVAVGNTDRAYHIVNERLEAFAKRNVNQYWFLRFSLLKHKITALSSSPARALSVSLQCLNSTLTYGFLDLVLRAVLQVGLVLVRLEQYGDCRDLLLEALPKFEYTGDIELRSELYLRLAESLIELHASEEDQIKNITKVIHSLEVAVDGFQKISHLRQVKCCLELQQRFGQYIEHKEIIDHAESSLAQIRTRIREEIQTN